MAVSPLTVATQGLLNSPLSVAAVRGHLRIEVKAVITRKPGGSSAGRPLPSIERIILDEPVDQWRTRVMREDAEILEIIIVASEVLLNADA